MDKNQKVRQDTVTKVDSAISRDYSDKSTPILFVNRFGLVEGDDTKHRATKIVLEDRQGGVDILA